MERRFGHRALPRRSVVLAVAGAVAFSIVSPVAPAESATDTGRRDSYIVELTEDPLAAFDGAPGFAGTSPAVTGQKLDMTSQASRRWSSHLDSIQARVLRAAAATDAPIGYNFRTVLSGFAARLTPTEVTRLRETPGVQSVTGNRVVRFDPPVVNEAGQRVTSAPVDQRPVLRSASPTGARPMFRPAPVVADPPALHPTVAPKVIAHPRGGSNLSSQIAEPPLPDGDLTGDIADLLDLPEGLWAQLGGPEKAGAGIVVGVIDTGILTNHPSFADRPVVDGVRNYVGPAFKRPAKWKGACQTGIQFSSCNNKVIGARYFVEGFGADNVDLSRDELSPFAVSAHGVQTAAIAAGNYGVDPEILGNELGVGFISGVAPRAQIAAYKVFWHGDGDSSLLGTTTDFTAAVDAAVADGVDVLNMSIGIGGWDTYDPTIGGTNLTDPFSTATLRAFDAGVMVVEANGNEGPDLLTTINAASSRPWLTSAGASTLARAFQSTATFSDPVNGLLTIDGESLTAGLPAAPVVTAESIPASGVDPALATRCLPGTLDPVAANGKAIVCVGIPGVDFLDVQAFSVAAAGGAAYIFGTSTPVRGAVGYPIPSIDIKQANLTGLLSYLATAVSPTVALSPAHVVPSQPDRVSLFSSRGPAFARDFHFPGQSSDVRAGNAEFIKPDVAAPGEDILVATTPNAGLGEGCFGCPQEKAFSTASGTSYASPTTAGAAALLIQQHPHWSPAAVKSALATTGVHDVTLVDGATPATPFDIGGGRLDPTRAGSAGLVLETSTRDFLGYLEANDSRIVPGKPKPVLARDLNLPSISLESLAGPRTIQRTFTNVDRKTTRWDVSVEGLPGITATANPSNISVRPGRSQRVDITFTPTTAPLLEWSFGTIVLTNIEDGRTIRLAVAALPSQENTFNTPINTDRRAGRAPIVVETGYSGSLSAAGTGLAAPNTQPDVTIGQGAVPLISLDPAPGLRAHDISVPPGAQLLQVQVDGVDGAASFWQHRSDLDLYLLYDAGGDGFTDDDLIATSISFFSGYETIGIADPQPGSYRALVHAFETATPNTTYDFTSWVIADSTPDVLASPAGPGIRVSGEPANVAPGDALRLNVEYDRLTTPGLHLGIVTIYDTPTPTPGHEIDQQLVEVRYEPRRGLLNLNLDLRLVLHL